MTTIIISPVSTVDNTVVGICNKYLFVINNYSLVRAQGTCFPICCKIIVLVSIPLKMYPFPFTPNGSDFSTCTGFIVILISGLLVSIILNHYFPELAC